MDVASATNERTMIATVVPDMPCGNSVPVLGTAKNPLGIASYSKFYLLTILSHGGDVVDST